MTIGNVTKDRRLTVSVYDAYAPGWINHLVGVRTQRSWNGTDWPKVKPARPIPEERSPGLGSLSRPPTRARREEHPYTCSGSKITSALCYAHRIGNPALFRTSNGWTEAIETVMDFPANAYIAMLGTLRQRVAGSSFNAGVFLGEGRESLRMIANTATTVANSLRLVKRGRVGEAARLLTGKGSQYRIKKYDDPNWIESVPFNKRDNALRQYDRDISSNWLELQYGWLPLLSDAREGAEFLAHQFSAPLQHRVVVRRTISQKNVVIASSSPIDFEYANSNRQVSRQIIAYLREVDTIALSGLTDPLSVAWELVPWSFVVDWFIPIGNYLSARGLAQSLKGDYIVSTFSRSVAAGLRLKPSNGSNFASQWTLTSGHPQCKQEFFRVTRQVVSTLGVIPLPEAKPLGDVPSWRRAANSVALLYQQIPSDRKITEIAGKLRKVL